MYCCRRAERSHVSCVLLLSPTKSNANRPKRISRPNRWWAVDVAVLAGNVFVCCKWHKLPQTLAYALYMHTPAASNRASVWAIFAHKKQSVNFDRASVRCAANDDRLIGWCVSVFLCAPRFKVACDCMLLTLCNHTHVAVVVVVVVHKFACDAMRDANVCRIRNCALAPTTRWCDVMWCILLWCAAMCVSCEFHVPRKLQVCSVLDVICDFRRCRVTSTRFVSIASSLWMDASAHPHCHDSELNLIRYDWLDELQRVVGYAQLFGILWTVHSVVESCGGCLLFVYDLNNVGKVLCFPIVWFLLWWTQ